MPQQRSNPETIAAAWSDYLARVIPADAPEIQRTECKRAFYAGAGIMFTLVCSAGDRGDQAGMNQLSALFKEVTDFVEIVQSEGK